MVSSITPDGKSIPKKSKSRRTSRSKSSGSSTIPTTTTATTTATATSPQTNRNNDNDNDTTTYHNNTNPLKTTTAASTTTKSSSTTTSPTANSTNILQPPPSSSTTTTSSTKTKSKTTFNHNASSSSTTASSAHQYRKHGSSSSSSSNNNMVLVADRKRGVYECDYCRVDISQACRIRCAVCPDFDLCLDCFATTDPSAAGTIRAAAKAAILLQQDTDDGNPTSNTTTTTTTPNTTFAAIHHEPTHGYRVCDSTKFPLFPSLRGVEPKHTSNNNDVEPTNNHEKQQDSIPNLNNVKQEEKEKDTKTENVLKEEIEKETVSKKDEIKTETNEPTPVTETKDEKIKQTSKTMDETDKSSKKRKNDIVDEKHKKPKITNKEEIKTEEETRKKKKKKKDFVPMIVIDDPKTAWTAEEDLRLLDAISTYGLGNWADIAEAMYSNNNNVSAAGTSTVNMNKYAKRCMERYLDDFLGTYGHIVPPYTLVQESTTHNNNSYNSKLIPPPPKKSSDDYDTNNTLPEPLDSKKIKEDDVSSGDRKRKRSKISPFVSYASLSPSSTSINNTGANSNTNTKGAATIQPKKYKVVPTSTLHGYKHIWPDPYILPNHKIGEDVGRDLAARAEQTYVKLSNNCSSKKEFEELEKEWKSTRLNKPGGPTALPPRLIDIQSLEGSELAGFMPRRGDFDMEWENDAEQILADMEFSQNDPPQDVALKLQIISIYNEKLDDREKRKAFLTERHLLDYRKNQARDQALPPEDRDLIHRMRLFARFHKSSEEHDKFIDKLLKAKKLRKEIATLQMYRKLGITSLAEAERYELDKSRREHHKHAHKQKEIELEEKAKKAAAAVAASSATDGIDAPSSSALLSGPKLWKEYYAPRMTERKNRKSINRGTSDARTTTTTKNESINSESEGNDKVKKEDANEDNDKVEPKETPGEKKKEDVIPMEVDSSTPSTVISKSPGYHLLSSSEIGLCNRLSMLPKQYLEAKKELIRESITQGLLEGDNKNSVFKIDVEKRDSIVEFVMTAGWISSKLMVKQPTIAPSNSTPTTKNSNEISS